MGVELCRRQEQLQRLLARKDREIQDYKEGGAKVSRSRCYGTHSTEASLPVSILLAQQPHFQLQPIFQVENLGRRLLSVQSSRFPSPKLGKGSRFPCVMVVVVLVLSDTSLKHTLYTPPGHLETAPFDEKAFLNEMMLSKVRSYCILSVL